MASSSSSLSGPFKALADNPLDFLKKNAIEFAPISVPREYRSDDGATFRSGKAGVKLVQTPTATVYKLQFVAIKDLQIDKEATTAFLLGFKQNRGNDDVPFLDIPRKNVPYLEGTFMFTVGLTGCSVVVTRLDGDKYRVFHDRRMDSAVLYDNVEMCVNFNHYRIGGRYLSRTGNAITLMQFKDGAWKMFLQRQLPPRETDVVPGGSPKWEVYAVEQKGPLSAESLEKLFNDRRLIIQNRVKGNARLLKVDNNLIDGAKDGVVRGVEFDEDAIRGWKALRNAFKSQIQIDCQQRRKQWEQEEEEKRKREPVEEEKKKRDPPEEKKPKLFPLADTYVRFEEDVSDSQYMDETWIWLQVKKNKAKVQH